MQQDPGGATPKTVELRINFTVSGDTTKLRTKTWAPPAAVQLERRLVSCWCSTPLERRGYHTTFQTTWLGALPPPPWTCGKASASRAGGTGIDSRFSQLSHASDLKTGTLGVPLTLVCVIESVLWTVGPVSLDYGWGSKFYLQFLFQCGSTLNYLSRSVHEVHFAYCLEFKQARNNHTQLITAWSFEAREPEYFYK